MVSLMRVSGKETFSPRIKAEITSKRVCRQDVERWVICNVCVNTCKLKEKKNNAHLAIGF